MFGKQQIDDGLAFTSNNPEMTDDDETDLNRRNLQGAISLLRNGLRVRRGDYVLVLCQKTLHGLTDIIQVAGNRLGVRIGSRSFLAKDFFGGHYPVPFGPGPLAEERPVPAAIVLAIEWSEETTEGRLRMLGDLANSGQAWRVASMPGLSLSTLPLCDSSFSDIKANSSSTFAALARSPVATITTVRPDGEPDNLVLRIPSCPILSTGEIDPGSWGNFPSGEVFVLPEVGRASGWLTLRGSFPHRALKKSDWVRFEITRGRIRATSVQASLPTVRDDFLSLFFTRSARAKGRNTNAIAELGVGTNPGITRLTGAPLFDEKKLGTVHLGVGRNNQFGGPLESACHHDLTIEHANLTLTTRLGKSLQIIKKGRFVLDGASALPRIGSIEAEAASKREYLYSEDVAVEFAHDGDDELESRMLVRYAPPRGSAVTFAIAHGEVSQEAAAILYLLKQRERKATVSTLAEQLGFSRSSVQSVLSGLEEYGVVRRI